MKGVYVFFADGFEETEALTTVDMLLRGGVDVKTVSIYDHSSVRSAHKIHIMTELDFNEFLDTVQLDGTTDKDFMVFPGGIPGATNLADNRMLMDLMVKHYLDGGSVAAICASPSVVLSHLPDIQGKKMTCYDGFEPAMQEKGGCDRRKNHHRTRCRPHCRIRTCHCLPHNGTADGGCRSKEHYAIER